MDAMTQATQEQHEIEQAFAGAVLINGDYARAHVGWLSPDVFTDTLIASWWGRVIQGGNPLEVGYELKMGGDLIGWQQRVTTHLDVDHYAKALSRSAYLRFCVMGAGDLVRAAQRGDENEIDIILETMKSMDSGVTRAMRSPLEIGASLKRRIEQGDISIPYGIQSLDWATGGSERGTFTILAGRTSMGKSSLAFQWAEHQALVLGLKVGFFALEMSAEQMFARRLCHKIVNLDGDVASWQDVRNKFTSQEEQDRLFDLIDEYTASIEGKLFVNDETNTTTADVLRTQMREKFDVLYVDHIGIFKDRHVKGERYDQYLGRMALALHEIAKNTNASVFGLAQLNREVEKRSGNKPVLADLQDSGKLEQNSDGVILMFRQSYYDKSKQKDVDPMELILGKYRDGARANSCYVGFNLREQHFISMWAEDLEETIEEGLKEANGAQQADIPF